MTAYFWIGLGGAIGSVARFAAAGAVAKWLGQAFLGTMMVNVSGSFVIGLIAAFSPGKAWEQLLMVGILGGYTTFSSFSLQTLALGQQGRWGAAGLNVFGSVAFSLAAVWLGHLAGAFLAKR